jgi:DnaJ-class molecular chaperone
MAGMEPNWRECDFCGGDGVRTVEWNTHGEATCGTCRGTGRVPEQTALPCVDGAITPNDEPPEAK